MSEAADEKPMTREDHRRRIVVEEAMNRSQASSDMLKWTLGSLLVINGGALVALIGIEESRRYLFGVAGWLFSGGMLAALVGGFFESILLFVHAQALFERAWRDAPIDEPSLHHIVQAGGGQKFFDIGAFVMWVISFILFVAGCFAVAEYSSASVPPAVADAATTKAAPAQATPRDTGSGSERGEPGRPPRQD